MAACGQLRSLAACASIFKPSDRDYVCWRRRLRVIPKTPLAERPPTWLEMESVKPPAVASEITSLGSDALRRNYSDMVIKLSPNRDGMRLRDILAIASGAAHRGRRA